MIPLLSFRSPLCITFSIAFLIPAARPGQRTASHILSYLCRFLRPQLLCDLAKAKIPFKGQPIAWLTGQHQIDSCEYLRALLRLGAVCALFSFPNDT